MELGSTITNYQLTCACGAKGFTSEERPKPPLDFGKLMKPGQITMLVGYSGRGKSMLSNRCPRCGEQFQRKEVA